ncbi:MAG: response regulator transcription factor [Sulfurovum sp.]|nr:response regulator transcription factor [Sulfurovum sp.]
MDHKQLFDHTKDLSVLLVEDHQPTRLGLEEILMNLCKEVVSFSNGEEAYNSYADRFGQTPYDLVITDIQMPKIDGVTLTKKLKELHPQQQIIVLSAYTDKEYLLELINIGISYFVTKPFEYDDFLQTLGQVGKKAQEYKLPPVHHNDTNLLLKGNMQWDKEKKLLRHEKSLIELSRNELFLMNILAQNGEQITTTQSLIERFYMENIDITEGGIRNLVLRIRKKLPEDIIGTVYGMGYKLILA